MPIKYRSPNERKVYLALAKFGDDGGSVNQIRKMMKHPPLSGTVLNALSGLKTRGLVRRERSTGNPELCHQSHGRPVDVYVAVGFEAAGL